jgi:RNA recognition motif-containing protein
MFAMYVFILLLLFDVLLISLKLPWSTSNEDLIELFTTIGKVERAEIQYEPNGRSRGTGVVEFEKLSDAETAIGEHIFPNTHVCTSSNKQQPNSLGTSMVADPLASAMFVTPI